MFYLHNKIKTSSNPYFCVKKQIKNLHFACLSKRPENEKCEAAKF